MVRQSRFSEPQGAIANETVVPSQIETLVMPLEPEPEAEATEALASASSSDVAKPFMVEVVLDITRPPRTLTSSLSLTTCSPLSMR